MSFGQRLFGRKRSAGFSRQWFISSLVPCSVAAVAWGRRDCSLVCSAQSQLDTKEESTLLLKTKKTYFYTGPLSERYGPKIRIFACLDQPIASSVTRYLGVPLGDLLVSQFSDGEANIKVIDNVRGKHVFIVCSTSSADRLMELLLSISAISRASAKSITAVIPYYGYARQDRIARPGEPIAAADVAKMIEVVGCTHVITVNLHSDQTEGFFDVDLPVDNVDALPLGAAFFSEQALDRPVIVCPHEAATKRALSFRDAFSAFSTSTEVGLASIVRTRRAEGADGGLELIGDVNGRDCILVDDLVDTGASIISASKLLKRAGAKRVQAFCVHGRFSAQALQEIEHAKELDSLVVTDTIPHAQRPVGAGKVQYLTVAPFLAEVMKQLIETEGSITNILRRSFESGE